MNIKYYILEKKVSEKVWGEDVGTKKTQQIKKKIKKQKWRYHENSALPLEYRKKRYQEIPPLACITPTPHLHISRGTDLISI